VLTRKSIQGIISLTFEKLWKYIMTAKNTLKLQISDWLADSSIAYDSIETHEKKTLTVVIADPDMAHNLYETKVWISNIDCKKTLSDNIEASLVYFWLMSGVDGYTLILKRINL